MKGMMDKMMAEKDSLSSHTCEHIECPLVAVTRLFSFHLCLLSVCFCVYNCLVHKACVRVCV